MTLYQLPGKKKKILSKTNGTEKSVISLRNRHMGCRRYARKWILKSGHAEEDLLTAPHDVHHDDYNDQKHQNYQM